MINLFVWPDACLELCDRFFERLRRAGLRDAPLALFLLAPSLLIIGAFGIAPIVSAIRMSLYRVGVGSGEFVGMDNYFKAFSDKAFWNALLVTVYYALFTIPVTMAFSFAVAHWLSKLVRAKSFFKTIFFLPYVTPAVAAAMIWRVILHPDAGPANAALSWLGLEPQQWILEPRGVLHILTQGFVPYSIGPSLSLCCVMFFDIWHSSGFMIVILLAALASMPRELEEAASIDGAGRIATLWNVTLPVLSPTLFFLAVVGTIRSFQAFSSFYALTGDGRGPLDTTQNLTVYIYTNFYQFHRWGYAAAVAVLLCIGIVSMTLIQWRFLGRKVYYE